MSLHDNLLRASPPDKVQPLYKAALVKRDYAAALPVLQSAVRNNDAHAMGLLGALYMLGQGVRKDAQEAYLWFRQGASRGDAHSQTALGLCLMNGHGSKVDIDEAAYWLYRAGATGHLLAISTLGALVNAHPGVVGKHFSEDQVCDLLDHWTAQAKTQRLKMTSQVARSVSVPASTRLH